MQAKRVLLGFLGDCASASASASGVDSPFTNNNGNANTPANNSFVLDVYKRLTKLEQQLTSAYNCSCSSSASGQSSALNSSRVNETMSDRVARKEWNDNRSPADRYADYKYIANMKPAFWLSAHYFDGLKRTDASVRTGLVNKRTDVVGNRVAKLGSVQVIDDMGNSAYAFDKSSSITSTSAVQSQYTLIVAYRFASAPTGAEGRFFTSSTGNRLFAGNEGCPQRWHVDGWINSNCVRTNEMEVLIGTNDNGVKNLWTYDQHLVRDSSYGINDWGYTVIGLPVVYAGDAVRVNVYEAMVFDKVLSAEQRNYVFAAFRKWYNL